MFPDRGSGSPGGRLRARPGLLLALGLLLGLVCATASPRSFSELGRGRGLEAGMAVALAFDGDGFLWVGSREGLYRYDGYEARVFRPDPADAASISDGDIRALQSRVTAPSGSEPTRAASTATTGLPAGS